MPLMPKPRRGENYSSAEDNDFRSCGFAALESEYESISDCTASYKWARDEGTLPSLSPTTVAEETREEESECCGVSESTGGDTVCGGGVMRDEKEREEESNSSGVVEKESNGGNAERQIENLTVQLTEAKKALKEQHRREIALRDRLAKEEALSDERLRTVEALRQRYFFSLSMAMKLERRLTGQEAQIEVQPLWLELQKEDVPFHGWPEWLSAKLALLAN